MGFTIVETLFPLVFLLMFGFALYTLISSANTGGTYYNTKYFATFQFESGDRLELSVSPGEYGMLVEGDRGQLSFQGTRYLGFARK